MAGSECWGGQTGRESLGLYFAFMPVNEKLQKLLRSCDLTEDRIASMDEKEAYAFLAGEYLFAFRIAFFATLVLFTFFFGLDWALFDAIIPQLATLHFWIGLVGAVLLSWALMVEWWVPVLMTKGITGGRVTMLLTVLFAAVIAAFVPQFVVDVVDYCVLKLFGVEYVPSRWQ